MKVRLRERVQESKNNSYIARIFLEIERIRASIGHTITEITAAFTVETVLELPPIPTVPSSYKKVFWTSAGTGNGDDQMWEVYTGQTKYTPCQYSTLLSGVPIP